MAPISLRDLSPENVLASRARLGEGPLWDSRQQMLYWVDILNHRVHVFEPSSGDDCHWDVGGLASALALMDGDRLLLAIDQQLAYLDLTSGEVTTLATLDLPSPDIRCNDGKCDPQGRFWIGTLSQEPGQAALYRYDPDGSLHTMETGLTISNGLGWSPDGTRFYLTNSSERTIYAYRFDGDSGNISDRVPLITLKDEAIEPDGLAVDSTGNIWTALWDGWCVACFSPSGECLGQVDLPVQRPTCPTFGGPDLRTLYVTSAGVGLSQQQVQAGFEAGDLFAIATPVPGQPTHGFRGPGANG